VRAEEPRGRERLELRDWAEDPEGQLQERHEILRVAGEHGVAFAGDRVPGAVGDREGEGLESGGAAPGVRGEDDVAGARPEQGLHERDALDDLGRKPAALEEEERLPSPFPGWKRGCGEALLSLLLAAMLDLNLCFSHGSRQRRVSRNGGYTDTSSSQDTRRTDSFVCVGRWAAEGRELLFLLVF
jgi:hypothetical protein